MPQLPGQRRALLRRRPVASARTPGRRDLRPHRRDLREGGGARALHAGSARRDGYRRDLRGRQHGRRPPREFRSSIPASPTCWWNSISSSMSSTWRAALRTTAFSSCPTTSIRRRRLVEALQRYLANGGALIASHRSLFDSGTGDFALPELGVKFLGESRYRDEYFYPATGAFPDLPDYAYFLYQRGLSIEATAGDRGARHLRTSLLRSLARTLQLSRADAGGPANQRAAVVTRGRTAYIANPFFSVLRVRRLRRLQTDGRPRLIRRLLPATGADGEESCPPRRRSP